MMMIIFGECSPESNRIDTRSSKKVIGKENVNVRVGKPSGDRKQSRLNLLRLLGRETTSIYDIEWEGRKEGREIRSNRTDEPTTAGDAKVLTCV